MLVPVVELSPLQSRSNTRRRGDPVGSGGFDDGCHLRQCAQTMPGCNPDIHQRGTRPHGPGLPWRCPSRPRFQVADVHEPAMTRARPLADLESGHDAIPVRARLRRGELVSGNQCSVIKEQHVAIDNETVQRSPLQVGIMYSQPQIAHGPRNHLGDGVVEMWTLRFPRQDAPHHGALVGSQNRALARQAARVFDQGLFTVLGDVSGQDGRAHLPRILTAAELEKARVDAANIKVGAPVLRSSNMEAEQLHVA